VGAETDIQIKAKFFQAMSDVMQAELGADASAVTGQ
jgi:hypothetical protein